MGRMNILIVFSLLSVYHYFITEQTVQNIHNILHSITETKTLPFLLQLPLSNSNSKPNQRSNSNSLICFCDKTIKEATWWVEQKMNNLPAFFMIVFGRSIAGRKMEHGFQEEVRSIRWAKLCYAFTKVALDRFLQLTLGPIWCYVQTSGTH